MSKKCPNCNKELPDEASFCMHCFTKVISVKAIKEEKRNNKKNIFSVAFFAVILLSFVLIAGLFFNNKGSNEITTTDNPTTTQKITITSTTSTMKSKTKALTTTLPTQTTEQSTDESTTDDTTNKATESITEANTTNSTTIAATTTTTKQSTIKKETTQPSGSLKYSSYGNGIIITSYYGNESTVTIPNKIDGRLVLAVGKKAFSDNKHIKAIIFEESSSAKTINIKANAFYNLSSLTKINLPSQVEADNFTNCISACPALKSVNISTKFSNTEYYSSNGVIYKNTEDGVALILYPAGIKNSSFTLPYKVSKINNNSFKGNPYLNIIKFSKREKLDVSWSNLFAKSNLKNLETIEVYAGTDADIIGIQYFEGEILYYD